MTFEEYVRARRVALLRFARVLCADPVAAEDLTADVLAIAFERWEQIGVADNVHAYVRRMLVNRFLGWRRGRVRTPPYADLDALLPTVGDHAEERADHLAIAAELVRLPRQQRAALVLRYFEGLGYAEIASALGCGAAAARSNVSRALATLRITMTDELSPHPQVRPEPRPVESR